MRTRPVSATAPGAATAGPGIAAETRAGDGLRRDPKRFASAHHYTDERPARRTRSSRTPVFRSASSDARSRPHRRPAPRPSTTKTSAIRTHGKRCRSRCLGITRFRLPEGAKFWVYDPAQKRVEGPYTSRHHNQDGSLWTPIIEGDEIVIDANGRASWKATDLAPGTHRVVASYVPDARSAFLPSSGGDEVYVVAKD
jgi:hypothetical protein